MALKARGLTAVAPWLLEAGASVLATPWGFDVHNIEAPVQLWHGDLDLVIPLHHGRFLASAIPSATLRICAGEGHMLMWNHLSEIPMAAAGVPSQAGVISAC